MDELERSVEDELDWESAAGEVSEVGLSWSRKIGQVGKVYSAEEGGLHLRRRPSAGPTCDTSRAISPA